MKRVTALALASFVSFTAASGAALAQSAKTLVGAWTLVDVGDVYGKNPKGSLIFDASGRYEVKDKTLIMKIESSTFPNWNGTSQERPLTVAKDELRYKVATPSAGPGTGANEVVWKRAK